MTPTQIEFILAEYLALPPDHPHLIEARTSLRNGDCPLCGRSGFVAPLMHIAQFHRIPAREFRNIIGARILDRLCTPEYTLQRQQTTARFLPLGNLARSDRPRQYTRAGRHNLSTAKYGTGLGYRWNTNSNLWEAYAPRHTGASSKFIGLYRTELAAAYAAWIARLPIGNTE